MVQHKVFILKVLPVDAECSPAITAGNVTTLNHERRDDPVEDAVLVRLALKAIFRRQCHKVFYRFGGQLTEETDDQLASGTAVIAYLYGERHFVCHIHFVRLRKESM